MPARAISRGLGTLSCLESGDDGLTMSYFLKGTSSIRLRSGFKVDHGTIPGCLEVRVAQNRAPRPRDRGR